jgi:predicted regulator of Ras-like GTPase activity (Roadblock/LC7/MglB family)
VDNLEHEVMTEIRALRDRVRFVSGSLVSRADGLLIAHDTFGVQPEGMAALSATTLGLSERVAVEAGHGRFQEALVRGAHGYVVTYAAGTYAVLTVLATADTNLGRLHLEARALADRVGALVDAAEGTARGTLGGWH